jgi:hypothetical protein
MINLAGLHILRFCSKKCRSLFFYIHPVSFYLKQLIRANSSIGRAVAQAVSRWLSTAVAWVRALVVVGFVVDKWYWTRCSSSISVSTAKHSSDCSTLIYHRGLF